MSSTKVRVALFASKANIFPWYSSPKVVLMCTVLPTVMEGSCSGLDDIVVYGERKLKWVGCHRWAGRWRSLMVAAR